MFPRGCAERFEHSRVLYRIHVLYVLYMSAFYVWIPDVSMHLPDHTRVLNTRACDAYICDPDTHTYCDLGVP